ncbi:MAG: hypothetical protein L6425_03775 [Candidatus Aminicenantes bacterium]|nr:hypothetical protein [Acidobacteriota bacterium]MCG2815042.1 hypothetical protein [Candidatus Aminicenantes bacterium]
MNLFDLESKYKLLLTPLAVPVGYYSSEVGQKLYLSALSEHNEDAIEADIRQVEKEIIEMLRGVTANKT